MKRGNRDYKKQTKYKHTLLVEIHTDYKWTETEVNAVLLQFLAGEIREMEAFDTPEDYEQAMENGTVSGRVYRGDDGEWYAYIGC